MSINHDQEEDQLLVEFKGPSRHTEKTERCTCAYHPRLQQAFILVLPSILLGFLMAFLIWILKTASSPSPREVLFYSPGNELIEYETRTFYRSRGGDNSPYQGWPTAEIDRTWDDATMAGLFTYIDEDSAALLPNKTERVAREGYEDKYMVVLDVFHQLHCLNIIRMAFYPDRYSRGMYHKNGTLNYCNWLHIDHCIDQVRQSLMCSADVAPIPIQWNDATKAMRPRVDTLHTCRNFERLREWSLQRNLSEFHGAARVVQSEAGELQIEDFLERKHSGEIVVDPSECNAI